MADQMAWIARAVAPEMPHHVTQRGNRRQQTFFNDEDRQAYLELISEWCAKYKVQICPNQTLAGNDKITLEKILNR